MKKKEMDKIYEKNKIEYGDKNFQYDTIIIEVLLYGFSHFNYINRISYFFL